MANANQQNEPLKKESLILTPTGPPIDITITAMPNIALLFARLLALSAIRPLHLTPDTVLGNVVIRFDNYLIDPKKIAAFKQICGYGCRDHLDTVPAPFIQTLFIGLISKFIGTRYFPISPMGLIQVGQSFELFQPIPQNTRLDLSCRLLDMTCTHSGVQTRIRMDARTAGADTDAKPMWQGTARYLTRTQHKGPKTKPYVEEIPLPIRETIAIQKSIGRRYATVSRDFNPHHLYGWTSKCVGFKQPIVHGMWSLSRTCASLETALNHPDTYKIDGQFKLPIFMPGTVTLGYDTDTAEPHEYDNADRNTNHVRFELRDKAQGLPHLKGECQYSDPSH